MNNKYLKFCFFVLLPLLFGCKTNDKIVQGFKGPDYTDDYSDIADIKDYKKWGPYNVHDPGCIKTDSFFYVYSTDAIYFKERPKPEDFPPEVGNIQVRRSKDLIKWEFVNWAFNTIPEDAIKHIEYASGGRKPINIWAPFPYKWKDEYRLYYAVSVFGGKTSYIGMAVSASPEGPWELKGCVVKTFNSDKMNAIDPSVITDVSNGKMWMHYGSFFGGLYCVELDPETGLTLKENDKGHLVARRADYRTKNLEAPEIMYNNELKKYYLFTSYDALFSNYNVRVGVSDKPEGPFTDYFGKDLADTTNDYPILTNAYRFKNHPGWAGVAHCGIVNDNGNYYMLHQGRLAPENLKLYLHVRKIFWNSDGWPVVSPERYAGVPQTEINVEELAGNWELITLNEIADSILRKQGQVSERDWKYDTLLFNNSVIIKLSSDGNLSGCNYNTWNYEKGKIYLLNDNEKAEMILFRGWDWENRKETILFSGINQKGIGIYGKKI